MINLYNSSKKKSAIVTVQVNGAKKDFHIPPRQTADFPDSAKIISKPSIVTIVEQKAAQKKVASQEIAVKEETPVDLVKPDTKDSKHQNSGGKK
ncbi:MAG: hypothetical protein WC967_09215 [Balneolaceae bacterium]